MLVERLNWLYWKQNKVYIQTYSNSKDFYSPIYSITNSSPPSFKLYSTIWIFGVPSEKSVN